MKVIKYIFYKPYLLLFLFFCGRLYYFSLEHPLKEALDTLVFALPYIIIVFFVFKLLRSHLLRLVNLIAFFNRIPDAVLSGYLFIFAFFNPIPTLILALFSMVFIKTKGKSYVDEYGNQITQIKSLTSSVILSRKERGTGEEEHIVVTKLKKKPKKITYE